MGCNGHPHGVPPIQRKSPIHPSASSTSIYPFFMVNPVQNPLGRLLSEIISRSGEISVLDWVGKASTFHSCLPTYFTSYRALPSSPVPNPRQKDVRWRWLGGLRQPKYCESCIAHSLSRHTHDSSVATLYCLASTSVTMWSAQTRKNP